MITEDMSSDEIIRHALLEKKQLLRKNPSMKAYQAEIERRMDLAGPSENRLAVLAVMIEANLMDLHIHMKELADSVGTTDVLF